MKKYLNKENFILFYTLVITGLYPVFLQPARLSSFCSPLCAVLLHYFLIFVFFGMIPMSILKLVFKEDLKEYGLNFNNRAAGWKFILVVLPVLALLIWLSAGSSEMAEEYPLFKGMARNYKLFFLVEFFYLLYYIGWEFLFRGFIIRGLMKLKKYPLVIPMVIQVMASTLLHYAKPSGEIVLSLIAGLLLGYYVYKYRTIWFAIVIHFCAGLLMDIFVIIRN